MSSDSLEPRGLDTDPLHPHLELLIDESAAASPRRLIPIDDGLRTRLRVIRGGQAGRSSAARSTRPSGMSRPDPGGRCA